MLSQTMPYKCGHKNYKSYEAYHNHFERFLFSNVSRFSEFGFIGGKSYGHYLQGELDLGEDTEDLARNRASARRQRPYHRFG